jgi:hypothetical protein
MQNRALFRFAVNVNVAGMRVGVCGGGCDQQNELNEEEVKFHTTKVHTTKQPKHTHREWRDL